MLSSIAIQSYLGEYSVEIYEKKNSSVKRDKVLNKISKNSFLIIDSKVSHLYPDIINFWPESLTLEIEALETNKQLSTCEKIIKNLLDVSFKKDMKLVAIGGGIIQDITAFSASVLYRGVDWIFIPTTLLSQADSCIGSKTSINFSGVKNILGGFYPPKKIYCFLDFLETLPEDDIKSGIGEILHYYIVDNNSNAEGLMNYYEKIILDRSLLKSHVVESLNVKKKMIQIDEFDQNQRRVFNYGHTFGHAIEVMSDFEISHGQAVTLGMDIANFVSYSLGMIDKERFLRLKNILFKNIPNYSLKESRINEFIDLMKKDKKSKKDKIVCILPQKEEVAVVEISDIKKLKNLIKDYAGLKGDS